MTLEVANPFLGEDMLLEQSGARCTQMIDLVVRIADPIAPVRHNAHK